MKVELVQRAPKPLERQILEGHLIANPKKGVKLMNRRGEWGQNLPPKFVLEDEVPKKGIAVSKPVKKKRSPKTDSSETLGVKTDMRNNGPDNEIQREDHQPCAKRQRATSDAPGPAETGVHKENPSSSLKGWLGIAAIGELSIEGAKACTNGNLEKGEVKTNPGDSETKTAGSTKIRVQGRMTDYWSKDLNTWDPISVSSITLKREPERSPEEELSTVQADIDSLKLVDDCID